MKYAQQLFIYLFGNKRQISGGRRKSPGDFFHFHGWEKRLEDFFSIFTAGKNVRKTFFPFSRLGKISVAQSMQLQTLKNKSI
jgi:hypothetical protein